MSRASALRRGLSMALRALALACAFAATLVAWRSGGGAAPARPPPAPVARDARGRGDGKTEPVLEVATRLVEIAGEARFDVPRSNAAARLLAAHWRKMRPVYFAVEQDAAPFVTTLTLRTTATETQWTRAIGKQGEKTWAPDPRVWNMNEGSFEQRDALVAPAPSTITYRVRIPASAELRFSQGTLNATSTETVFVVTVVGEKGGTREICRHTLPRALARKWTDASCDLSAYAGQNVELRLSTETGVVTADDAPAPATKHEKSRHRDKAPDKEAPLGEPGAAVALWGNPTLFTRARPRLPKNVLWFVVDALRPDVLASFHDDADDERKRAAPHPPLETLLPKIPGLTPVIDDLANRCVRFTNAHSAATWTRPGTIAMLAGARSSEVGLDTEKWILSPETVARFYASDPPLVSLVLRKHGASTAAFVNNFFMAGYAPVGLDMGFEHVDDHRFRLKDTEAVTQGATEWIRKNKDERFFMFVNYNSPHEPWEPPSAMLARVPGPPVGPKEEVIQKYMAEAGKDDQAIGEVLQAVESAGIADRTLVVVTADHGETLSSTHTGTTSEKIAVRFHHAVGNYEETSRIPILICAPGQLAGGTVVKEPVRSIDIAPTVLDLLGIEPPARMTGRSLRGLASGQKEAAERVVVIDGKGSRAITHGRHRYVVHEGKTRTLVKDGKEVTIEHELYDLVDDPGERRNLAGANPDLVAEMRARLDAALAKADVAGSPSPPEPGGDRGPPLVRMRFAGAGASRRVSGSIRVREPGAKIEVRPVDLGPEGFKATKQGVELAFTTNPSAVIGFDLVVEPPLAALAWELYLDDAPWPVKAVLAGPFGLFTPLLRAGLEGAEARFAADATQLPHIDPARDLGVFVTRERRGAPREVSTNDDENGAEEMARLLREWGYVQTERRKPDSAER